MYYLYVIKSINHDKFYIGYTSDLKQRLVQHNTDRANFTSKFKPWQLVYYEAYTSSKLARMRERKLKQHGKGWAELKKRILESYEN